MQEYYPRVKRIPGRIRGIVTIHPAGYIITRANVIRGYHSVG